MAQSVECGTVDLGVMNSSPKLGAELTYRKKQRNKQREKESLQNSKRHFTGEEAESNVAGVFKIYYLFESS